MKNFILIYLLFVLALNAQKLSSTDAYKKLPLAYKNWVDGDLNGAITEFNKAAKNDIIYYNLGVLYFIKKDYDLAHKNFDLALKNNDELARAMYYKGLAYMAVENYTEAVKYLENAIEEDDNAYMYYYLSKSYSFLGNTKKALEHAKNAVNADNMYVAAQLLIVENLISSKKIDDALKLLNKIDQEMYPEADTYIKMGDLYQYKKDKNNAISSYKNYLHFYPKGKFAEVAKIKLLNYKISYDGSDVNAKELTEKYHIRLGERFKYVVSYGLNLGEMTATVDNQVNMLDNREHAKITFRVLSTSFLLPLDATYETLVDLKSLCSSKTFMVNHSDAAIQDNKMYVFDHTNHIFIARLTDIDGYIDFSEQELPVNTTDGTSILFYARGLIANKTEEAVTTVILEKFKRTDIYPKTVIVKESSMGIDQEYYYLQAKARYQGVAGMTGEAEGYFSKDDLVVPMIGKMQILVGKVRVEITEKN